MKALAVFHDHGNHILDPLLKTGFRHCFAAIASDEVWIRIDGQVGCPVFEVVAPADYDLASFYRAEGYTVIETEQRSTPTRWPLTLTNCVGLVKTVLCINAPLVVTPWRLYRHMTGARLVLPGKSGFTPRQPFSDRVKVNQAAGFGGVGSLLVSAFQGRDLKRNKRKARAGSSSTLTNKLTSTEAGSPATARRQARVLGGQDDTLG